MSADSPRRASGSRGIAVAATVPPQVVSDRSILDSAIGFINDVTLAHQPHTDPKDTITWARFETAADISDPRYGDDWELEGNVAPPLLLILGYGLGVQVWAVPANGEAVEVLTWRHGVVSALRVLPTPDSAPTIEEHGRADEATDAFADKRPLIALVDGSTTAGAQPQFCAVNFVSLKTGAQVKTIKFKNAVLDVLANRSAVVITFHERIAVFDARTLEDRLSVTTCYPSPGINPNPVALGQRWLAYAEHKLIHSKRSAAGCDGDGVASYTATMLNAAKSLGKGLRELGEHVAAGLTGTTAGSAASSKNCSFEAGCGPDAKQPGIVTILDIKHHSVKDYSPTAGMPAGGQAGSDPIVAHFIAHSEALVAMEFDNSGMLLLTADRRGHDFHIFRIQPHPVGSVLAAVHHLYVLHRGDTSAKVQNIAFSLDTRWVAVSTLRGTTHVFPITPYGGPMGVRTHTSLHVVNKLSRFHRSAGLSADGRSSSPISHSESTTFVQSLQPYHNCTLPPFPRPTVVLPLAQLRQPLALGTPPGTAAALSMGSGKTAVGSGGSSAQRQRLSSLSDDNGKPLSVCAIFAKSRSWLLDPPNVTREAPHRVQRKAVDSLFVMAGHGALIQYDLDTKLASNVAKEKICDETPIELEVEAKAQWNVGRRKDGSQELMPPLSTDNWLIRDRNSCMLTDSTRQYDDTDDRAESWLSQVEIITHAGPHRRLWMGPQFVFKTYNTPSGSNLNHVDAEAVEIGIAKATATAASAAVATVTRVERSSPLNMPLSAAGRAAVPVLIESGSYSSIEQSPKLMDRFRHDHLDSDFAVSHGDTRLKEDLADAMRESPSVSAAAQHKDTGRRSRPLLSSDAASSTDNIPFYDALTEHDDANDDDYDDDDADRKKDDAADSYADMSTLPRPSSVAVLASALPNIYCSYDVSSSYESLESLKPKQHHQQQPKPMGSIEKVVNPLGTVTTVTAGSAAAKRDILDEVVSQLSAEDCVIHENCDEALFRPVVAIFCDENVTRADTVEEARKRQEHCQPPELIGTQLVVPVIAKEVDDELSRKEKSDSKAKHQQQQQQQQQKQREQSKFAESFSTLGRRQAKTETLVVAPSKVVEPALRAAVGRELICEIAPTKAPQQAAPQTVQKKVLMAQPAESSTDERPMEFKRMTPVPAPKLRATERNSMAAVAKNEEPKAVAREKAPEAGGKATRATTPPVEVESPKKAPAPTIAAKKAEPKATATKRIEVSVAAPPPSGKRPDEKQKLKPEVEATAPPPSKLTTTTTTQTAVDSKRATDEERKSAAVEPTTNTTAKPRTSANKLNAANKDEEEEQQAAAATKEARVQTVLLNASHLADSLIELNDEQPPVEGIEEESAAATSQMAVAAAGKRAASPAKPLEEPIEIIAAPPLISKSAKKKKQKQNRSASSSEGEEVVEVTLKLAPKASEESLERKASLSYYETSYADLADSLLEKRESAISVSFSKTPEKQGTKAKGAALAEEKCTKAIETEKKVVGQAIVNDETKEKATAKQSIKSEKEEKKPIALEREETAKEKSTPQVGQDDKRTGKEEKWSVAKQEVTSKPTEEKKTLKGEPAMSLKRDEAKSDSKAGADVTTKWTKSEGAAAETVAPPKLPGSKTAEVELNKMMAEEKPKAAAAKENAEAKSELLKTPKKPAAVKPTASVDIAASAAIPAAKKAAANVSQADAATTHASSSPRGVASLATDKPPKRAADGGGGDSGSPNKPTKGAMPPPPIDGSRSKERAAEATAAAPPMPAPCLWNLLSGAEMISKNLGGSKALAEDSSYPTLGKPARGGKKPAGGLPLNELLPGGKLLPDIPTPSRQLDEPATPAVGLLAVGASKKTKRLAPSEVGGAFAMLEALPPLPPFVPLEMLLASPPMERATPKVSRDTLGDQASLINFESPLQENPALPRKITPPPRGFTEQNLILALCGSLHYEPAEGPHAPDASSRATTDVSPTLSLTPSSSGLGEPSAGDCKWLTGSDEPYVSFEQSSQDTNTTNTATTTTDKLSSSPNSSASEDVIVAITTEEKKLTKKQRRKQQQMELERQSEAAAAVVDEELRPLIGMSDSLLDGIGGAEAVAHRMHDSCSDAKAATAEAVVNARRSAAPAQLDNSTTDSEGPMPATTTSDDNHVAVGAACTAKAGTPHKLKTKKLEHKINLIAAIEAATSSSTSSAEEESGVEPNRRTPDLVDVGGGGGGMAVTAGSGGGAALGSLVAVAAMPVLPTPLALPHSMLSGPQGGTKKKTKRRKR